MGESYSANAWLDGRVCRIFLDTEGEWLTVVYRHPRGNVATKDTMRQNEDIRPMSSVHINNINLDSEELGIDELDEIALKFDTASENIGSMKTPEQLEQEIKSELSSAFPGMNLSRILGSS